VLASCGDDGLVRTWSFDPNKGFEEEEKEDGKNEEER
jgi:hypothetical protein